MSPERTRASGVIVSRATDSRFDLRSAHRLTLAAVTSHAAIRLYEKLGFRLRAPIVVTVLRRR